MSFVKGISTYLNPALVVGGRVLAGEAGCKDVDIRGKRSVIIQTDNKNFKEKVLNTFFKAGVARSISDYVVISDDLILICEMKSENEGNMKVQLKNTSKVIRYILALIAIHEKIVIPVPPIKYVCLANAYKGQKQTAKFEKLDSIEWYDGELFKLPCNSIYHLSQFI